MRGGIGADASEERRSVWLNASDGRSSTGWGEGPVVRSCLAVRCLPPEPKSSPLVQTLRWSFRPLPFMQECREKYGDNFSVKFLTFERPMVMISDPAAIKALYTERSHGLPPGRDIILTPIVGSRSLLVLEGADHLAHRKLMLPPFHGERMRSYQPMVEEIVDREIDSWPLGEEFPIHPRMQAITLEVILRGRLRRRRRARAASACAACSPRCWRRPPRPFAQLTGLASRRFGGRGPWAKFEGQLKEVDELLYAEIAEHRASGDLRGARRHPLAADAGPLRGRRGHERHRPARPADDPAARRPRDDGDGAGLDLRPAAPPPRAAAAPARVARGRRGRLPAGDDQRVAAPAPGRAAGRPPPQRRPRASTA